MSWGSVLEFDTDGFPVKLNGVTVCSLPPVQGAAGSVLHNDGAGNWSWQLLVSSGDVIGPAGATDGHLAVFDGPTGKLIKDGGAPGGGGAHNILSATHSDSTEASCVRGDIITGQGSSPLWTRLAKGSANAVLTGDGTDTAWSTGFLAITSTKTLTVTESLTLNALPIGGLSVATAANTLGPLAVGLTTQVLVGGGAATVPVWATDLPTAVTIGSAYIYRASGTDVAAVDGGTGQSVYAVGDLLYANTTTTIGKLADVAAGQPLLSGGVGVAPAYAGWYLDGTAGGKTILAVTNAKILTLTATDNFNFMIPATGTAAMLNQANSFTLINPLTTIAESWIGPSSTAGIYFKDGNVGIGTPSPGFKLDVQSPSLITAVNIQNTNTSGIVAANFANGVQAWSIGVDGTNYSHSFYIEDATRTTYPFVINTSGNVGIGTTAPAAPLHVLGSSYPVLFVERTTTVTTGFASGIRLRATTTGSAANGFGGGLLFEMNDAETSGQNILGRIGGVRDGADNSGALLFYTAAAGAETEKARITSTGNLLIGTTTDGMMAAGSLAIAKSLAHRGTLAGFFNATPVAQHAHVPDCTSGTVVATVNGILLYMEQLGYIANA